LFIPSLGYPTVTRKQFKQAFIHQYFLFYFTTKYKLPW